jgi:hypothetical protein
MTGHALRPRRVRVLEWYRVVKNGGEPARSIRQEITETRPLFF